MEMTTATTTDPECTACFKPATLIDLAARPWCSACVEALLICPSCGESRHEYGQVIVGAVVCCRRCAHKAPTEGIVTEPVCCEFCGRDLAEDAKPCDRCCDDPYDDIDLAAYIWP